MFQTSFVLNILGVLLSFQCQKSNISLLINISFFYFVPNLHVFTWYVPIVALFNCEAFVNICGIFFVVVKFVIIIEEMCILQDNFAFLQEGLKNWIKNWLRDIFFKITSNVINYINISIYLISPPKVSFTTLSCSPNPSSTELPVSRFLRTICIFQVDL